MNCPDLYDHILLNEGAYFFKVGEKAITNKGIKEVFDDVKEGGEYTPLTNIVRKTERIGGGADAVSAKCSLLIFRRTTSPTMFDFEKDAFPDKLKECKVCYLLIVEIRQYVVIVKKNVSHLTSFINSLIPISAKTIANILVNDTTDFQQMKLANMNTSKNAIRTKSYEANDLQISMPMFGTNQNIVTTVRFANDVDGVCTINIGTSRISKFGNKKGISSLIVWLNDLVGKIENYTEAETFLMRFAMPQSWKTICDTLVPTSLLINIFDLQNYIGERLDDKNIYRKIGKDTYKPFTKYFWRIFRNGSESIELTRLSDTQFRYKSIGVAKQTNGLNVEVDSPLDSLYYINEQGKHTRLKNLVNSLHCFTVCFSDFSYVYAYGKLYKNSEIDKDFESILSILKPVASIANVTSEKGEGYNSQSTAFLNDSLFHVVENELYNDAEILLCDDMGNEWADHIAIKGSTISYIHSKCKNTESLSASYFQDVIGQAVKNIGNMNPNETALRSKILSMRGTWQNTSIQKCRIGNVNDIETAYNSLMRKPNKKREVCLAVNFLSKSRLSLAFQNIKNQVPFQQKNSVIQMAWILNGFISICKQADLDCKIYCRE